MGLPECKLDCPPIVPLLVKAFLSSSQLGKSHPPPPVWVAISLLSTASLFLIYMDTLLGQIADFVKKEKRKQSWIAVTKES